MNFLYLSHSFLVLEWFNNPSKYVGILWWRRFLCSTCNAHGNVKGNKKGYITLLSLKFCAINELFLVFSKLNKVNHIVGYRQFGCLWGNWYDLTFVLLMASSATVANGSLNMTKSCYLLWEIVIGYISRWGNCFLSFVEKAFQAIVF